HAPDAALRYPGDGARFAGRLQRLRGSAAAGTLAVQGAPAVCLGTVNAIRAAATEMASADPWRLVHGPSLLQTDPNRQREWGAVRVLLIEDDRMIGQSLVHALRDDGHGVDWVRDGISGETALSDGTEAYALILLDWNLPGRSGITLLRDLRG